MSEEEVIWVRLKDGQRIRFDPVDQTWKNAAGEAVRDYFLTTPLGATAYRSTLAKDPERGDIKPMGKEAVLVVIGGEAVFLGNSPLLTELVSLKDGQRLKWDPDDKAWKNAAGEVAYGVFGGASSPYRSTKPSERGIKFWCIVVSAVFWAASAIILLWLQGVI